MRGQKGKEIEERGNVQVRGQKSEEICKKQNGKLRKWYKCGGIPDGELGEEQR